MASSQVQIAPLAPFGCVLKDYGGMRDRYGEAGKAAMTNQDTFHRKLKSLVRDHLPTITSDAGKDPQRKNDRIDPWFVKERRTGSPVKRENERSTLTPTQARIVDLWAAQQAREMVSTIKKHAHVTNHLRRSDPQTTRATTFAGESSPSQLSDNSTKGASSLVQMWEARLSQPNGCNNNTNSPRCSSRSNSTALSCPGNSLNSPRDEHLANVETVRQFNEDLTAYWESDGMAAVKVPSPALKCRASSASDNERGRVANIIRRLISKGDQIENEPSPAVDSPYREREHTSRHDHALAGQKPFQQATSSPRIRGRQAFSDFLMQMERDRQEELESLSYHQAVSRFSQKGCIQANLKLKILQRGVAAHEQHPLTLFCGSGRDRASNSPSIPQLREKPKTESELVPKEHNFIADLEAPPPSVISSESQMENTSAVADWPYEEINQELRRNIDQHQELPVPSRMMSTASQDDENSGERTSDTLGKDDNNVDPRTSDTMDKEDDENSDERTLDTMGKDDENSDTRTSDTMGKIVSYDDPNLERLQSMDACTSSAFWFEDEQESDEELPTESKYDWIRRISRPRSYWEDRRQLWYQEMLEQDSTKEDIRQLLQRRRVSNFLSSDFLEMLNELMLRKQTNILAQPEDDQIDIDFWISQIPQAHDRLTSLLEEVVGDQLMQDREEDMFQAEDNEIQDITQVMDGDRNEAEQELLDEEAEQEMVGQESEGSNDQYRDASGHSHQSTLSSQSSAESPTRSWGFDDNDVPVGSVSSAHSLRSQAYYMDPLQHTRSMDHLSMEIELINELRGQMKQLQREMSKLRRSIKTCMDMQAPMKYSMKQAISPSGRGDGRKIGCCFCFDKPVDSLLYRCGHMCTCLKCAVKLQFGNGNCPTCRAPIEDVVRACPDS